jgi:hypothetical protein
MGAAGAADPWGIDGRATAQDRHAGGDERHFVFAAHRLPWRYLPRDSSPPRSTVYNIFRKFQRDGVWEVDLGRAAYGVARTDGVGASPSAAVFDSQSVKSAENEAVMTGRWVTTPASKIKARCPGRQRGLPMRVVVHSTAIQDRDGTGLVLDKIRRRFPGSN